MAISFEKNRAEGVEDGVRWVTKDAPMYGAVNGYVQLPEGHPWREHNLRRRPERVDRVRHPPRVRLLGRIPGLHAGRQSVGDPPVDVDVRAFAVLQWTPDLVEAEAKSLARQVAQALIETEASA